MLATKLYIPPPRPKAVNRQRLIKRLNEGLQGRVTLIIAPAGSGKSTLASEWIAALPTNQKTVQAAWLSLEESDGDLTRFLSYFVAALQTLTPPLGDGVMMLLQSPQPPAGEILLARLLNEISVSHGQIVLVLDDYHLLQSQAVDRALAFLIDHLPPQIHLILTTREEPQLPLARLRARGQLTEVRAADLRFTPAETSVFLNQTMGLSLSSPQIAALEARTEGWVAGLQLAAISLRADQSAHLTGSPTTPAIDPPVDSFTGSHPFVLDYLLQEVLQRQAQSVQTFLLHTSILDRLCGPLCEAVTGQEGSQAYLQMLERGNFFIIPLDHERRWYRYHHLFAGALLAHLQSQQPNLLPTLHRRASVWYEANGAPAAAIRHALAGADFEQAARLIELALPAIRRRRQETTLLGWLKLLPAETLRARPVLNGGYGWALLATGQMEAASARLRAAEDQLQQMAAPGQRPRTLVVANEEEFRILPAVLAVYRGVQAQTVGDLPAAVKHARRVLDLASEDDYLLQGAAAALLGLAAWTNGALEDAYQSYAAGIASMQKAGNISDVVGGAIILGDIRTAQGRLHAALRVYTHMLQLSREQDEPPGTAMLYLGMGELRYEQNDLAGATHDLLNSQEAGKRGGFLQNEWRWYVAMARIRAAQGDGASALTLLDEAERLAGHEVFPIVRPAAAWRARESLRQGRVAEALAWARGQGLSVTDNLSFLREFEHITLARALMARPPTGSALVETMTFLDRLLQTARAGDRGGSVIEIRLLQALAHQSQGDLAAALHPLQEALTLGEAEGYARLFIDEGPPLARLLHEAANRGITPGYTSKLLAALEVKPVTSAGASPASIPPPPHPTPLPPHPTPLPPHPTPPPLHPLSEPLSRRELELLRLFKSDLSGPEIARELVVALSTVRTHTKHIYSKLNVTNRRAAVKRAQELKLI